MPTSMKIQPIDDVGPETEPVKPVMKTSRLKRLFRISVCEPPAQAEVVEPEPSSVCLAKMVHNFIEESTEKPSLRCNCFHGNVSDASDIDSDSNSNNNSNSTISNSSVCDFLKRLVVCTSVNEWNVLADTEKIIAEKKSCKRKDELRKIVSDGLVGLGYDAAICKSKWDKSPSFPAGEYEYVDVIIGGDRLIIDIDFRSEFEVARSTKTYKSILQTLPHIFVGKSQRLSKIISILSEASKQSLKKKGLHIPPWRKADYIQAKWLSPPLRITPVTPPSSPLSQSGSVHGPNSEKVMGPDPGKVMGPDPKTVMGPNPGEVVGPDHSRSSELKLSRSSPSSESIFDMSESSGEEEVKEREDNPKKGFDIGVEVITTLASIMEDKL